MTFNFRLATLKDIPVLKQVIATSARQLASGDYSGEQIDAALGSAWGVDTQLIEDETYFVVEVAGAGIVGCGGWSFRGTLFGSDEQAGRESGVLDSTNEAARIRAFFVHPDWSRRGIGRALLEKCECAARLQGFKSTALIATLPGQRLYRECGYIGEERVEYPLPNGSTITFVPMTKNLV